MNMNDLLGKLFGSQDSLGGATATADPTASQQVQNAYNDEDRLIELVHESIDKNDKMRWSFERLWFRSILYYIGNQWITWDGRSRRWREKKVRKWVPKPVTNRFASTTDSIVAAVQATHVMPSVWPATEDHDDIASANVADKIIPILDKEINVDHVRETAANWMVLNGDAFCLPYYDKNDKTLGETIIPDLACQICGTQSQPLDFEQGCPQCGQPGMTQPVMDESGQPVGQKYPIGKHKVGVYSPLQVYLNQDQINIEEQDMFTIMETMSLESVRRYWPETGSKVNPDAHGSTKTARHFMEALAYMSEDSSGSQTGSSSKDRTTICRHFRMPNDELPEGLWITVASDDTILESGPSPWYDEKEDGQKVYYWPLVKIPYRDVPGRLYAKTPCYDMLPKQDQLNRLESLIELAIMKGAHGTWLIPSGSSISSLSGEPAQVVKYTPTGTGGYKPEIVTSAPFDSMVLEWKKMLCEDFEELAGTFDALKGNVPRGVSAGYAIQLLTERSYGRFAPVFSSWETGWVKIYSILIRLFKVYATEDRIHKIQGYSGAWEIQKFSRSNLAGGVDVKVEGGASKPRSKLAEQALVESLAKLGVINAADPEQAYLIADMFGMTHILGAADDDVRAASQEWDEFIQFQPAPVDPTTGQPVVDPQTGQPVQAKGQPPLVRGVIDNHMVHIQEHKKRAKSDIYRQMPPDKQMLWQQHIMEHMMLMAPPPDQGPRGGPAKPAGSKANETSDHTMDNLREGGSDAYGSGGDNQYA